MRCGREKIRYCLMTLSWLFYDLANQFFALNIVSLYFPRWLVVIKGSPEVLYSITFGISMFLVAITAPILGVISDIRNRHRAFLVFFTLLSVAFTMSLGLTESLFLGLAFFAIANFGCQEATIFYNSLMTEVAPKNRLGLISGLGRMFGYSGAILALYFTKPVILKAGYQQVFFLTGLLFLIFSLPCMILIKEKPPRETIPAPNLLREVRVLEIFKRLRQALFDGYEFGGFRYLLKASFFMLCVVNTVILFMSIYAGKVFGLDETQLIDLIAFSTIFAMGGSIVSGVLSDIIGYRRSMTGVFFLWAICILSGGLLTKKYLLLIGALVGISLGSTWVVARAFVIDLISKENIGEAFGLFNLVSIVSAIVGTLCWGLALLYLSKFGAQGYRIAFLSLILFVAIGTVFLLRMPGHETRNTRKSPPYENQRFSQD